MNDLRKTTSSLGEPCKASRLEGIRMAQSKGAGRLQVATMAGHSGCAGQGNEATAANCEAANLVLEALVAEFERMGWDGHASYVQTMASHMSIYAHQIRARAEQ